MDDNFCVSIRFEDMTPPQQIGAEFLIVINLAIEDDPDCSVFIRQRLMSGAEINDGQTAKTQPDRPSDMISLIIGTTVTNRVRHRPEQRNRHGRSTVKHEFSADSAHN